MANKLHLRIDDLCTIESMTPRQFDFLENYHKYPVHLLHGFAGTGKTFLALYRALEDVLDAGNEYKRLIIIRSPVSAVQVGHLPGDLEEKGAVFEVPYMKITKDLFGRHDAYSRLKEQRAIQFFLSSHLRGDTFDRSILVSDEVQNMTYQELYTIITRVGVDSKIIFCGDTRQNDINSKSGLSQFMQVLDRMKSAYRVEFGVDDVVRSGIVKEFLIAESKIK